MAKQFRDLGNDHEIEGLIDMAQAGAPETGEFKPIILWDTKEEGLRLYIGRRAATWQYFRQSRDHGTREHTFRTLGRFDPGYVLGSGANPNKAAWEPPIHRAKWHMSAEAARRQARILAGKIEEGTQGANVKEGPTFRQAFTGGFKNADGDAITGYLEYLKATGKSDRWAYNVGRLGEQFLLPKWGAWSLIEMGKRPMAVKEWYLSMSDNPTSANHCARIIRALYRRAASMDHRLPARDPIAAIGKKEWHKERGEQKGMSGRDLHKWCAAWQAIPNATHRAFHLVNLLIGARPGELGRAKWRDLDADAMLFTMPDAKEENDIEIPITPEIVAAFALARGDNDRPNGVGCEPDDLIFPGCLNNPARDALPARGHALRRTYKTIAEDWCKVPSQISEYLEGRMPEGVKGRYLLKWARNEGPAIIEAQRTISKTIMALLHGRGPAPLRRKRAA
jgi:integrase